MSEMPERKRRRRRRWEPVDEKQAEQRELQARLDRISRTIATNTIPVDDLCRSPSPEPRYDNRGKRVNTRYDRALDKLEMERFKLFTRLKQLNPDFRPPHGMRPPKFSEKLYIPKEKEGTLNFIGLILGPRGNTQKRLERDYECKVAIRGKGSVKDGRARGPSQPEDNEPLHVVITAEGIDGAERIAQCKIRIMDIITPRQDDDNDHKQAQLRELARLNGTLRDQDRDFRTPAARAAFSDKPGGRIESGDGGSASHPSADASKKGHGAKSADLDADYQSFIAELDKDKQSSATDRTHIGGAHVDASQTSKDQSLPPWLMPGAFATRPPQPPPPGLLATPAPHAMPPPGMYADPAAQYALPSRRPYGAAMDNHAGPHVAHHAHGMHPPAAYAQSYGAPGDAVMPYPPQMFPSNAGLGVVPNGRYPQPPPPPPAEQDVPPPPPPPPPPPGSPPPPPPPPR